MRPSKCWHWCPGLLLGSYSLASESSFWVLRPERPSGRAGPTLHPGPSVEDGELRTGRAGPWVLLWGRYGAGALLSSTPSQPGLTPQVLLLLFYKVQRGGSHLEAGLSHRLEVKPLALGPRIYCLGLHRNSARAAVASPGSLGTTLSSNEARRWAPPWRT